MNRDEYNKLFHKVGLNRVAFKAVNDCDEEILALVNEAIAAEREKVAEWMMQRSYATGHGETTEDLLAELEWQIAENWSRALIKGVEGEREACIEDARTVGGSAGAEVEKLIRARGNHD